MSKQAIFIHGIRAGTIEFNNTEYGEELKSLLKENGCSIKPIEEISRAPTGGIGAAMIRQMIASYEKSQR